MKTKEQVNKFLNEINAVMSRHGIFIETENGRECIILAETNRGDVPQKYDDTDMNFYFRAE